MRWLGSYSGAAGATHPLLVIEHDGRWSATAAPLPPGAAADDHLAAVSCAPAGSCVAVGGEGYDRHYLGAKTPTPQGLIVTVTPGQTPRAIAPSLPGGGGGLLRSVSCPAARECAVVGDQVIDNIERAIAVDEHHGVWQPGTTIAQPADALANSLPYLDAVSCSAPGDCSAGGGYGWGEPTTCCITTDRILLAGETAGVWGHGTEGMVAGVQVPPNTTFPTLTSISCSAPGTCTAVGYILSDNLLISENGGQWSPAFRVGYPDDPSGTSLAGVLAAVSCNGVDQCAAVGGYETQSESLSGLITTAPASYLASTTTTPIPSPGTTTPRITLHTPRTATAGLKIAAKKITARLSGEPSPHGAVTLRLFGPRSRPPASCVRGGHSLGATRVTANRAVHPRAGVTPGKPGTYWWAAQYAGTGVIAGSSCATRRSRMVVRPGGTPKLVRARIAGTTAVLTVRCTGRGPCPLTASLTTRRIVRAAKSHRHARIRTITLRRARRTVRAGRRHTFRLPLAAGARRQLRSAHRLRTTAAITQPGRRRITRRLTFNVTAPRRGHALPRRPRR